MDDRRGRVRDSFLALVAIAFGVTVVGLLAGVEAEPWLLLATMGFIVWIGSEVIGASIRHRRQQA